MPRKMMTLDYANWVRWVQHSNDLDDRIGSQVRQCYICGKKQTVDDFNLTLDSHQSIGEFGDDEDLYICDADVGDVLSAVRRLKKDRTK